MAPKVHVENFLCSGWDLKSHKPGSHKPGAVQTELGVLKLKKPDPAVQADVPRRRQSNDVLLSAAPDRIAARAMANFASAKEKASSPHAAMLMCFIDALRSEASVSGTQANTAEVHQALQQTCNAMPAEAATLWETWHPQCEQALATLHSGWDATPVLRDIPLEHRHRFIIDADKLHAFEMEAADAGLNVSGSPWAGFLFTEPGYLLGAANAFKVAFDTQESTDAGLVERVHQAISCANPQIAQGMKQGTHSSIISADKFSTEAFSDIRSTCKELQARDGVSSIDFSPADSSASLWRTGSKPETTTTEKAAIIDRWAGDRDAALGRIGTHPKSAPLRAVALVDFFAKCNRLHAHEDGNGRMYQQVLLNRDLDRAGLPLSILPKPGNLHLKGLGEMLLELRDGMVEAAKYVSGAHPQALQVLRDMRPEDAAEAVRAYRDRFAWNASGEKPVVEVDSDDEMLLLDEEDLAGDAPDET